jgi:biotin synthase
VGPGAGRPISLRAMAPVTSQDAARPRAEDPAADPIPGPVADPTTASTTAPAADPAATGEAAVPEGGIRHDWSLAEVRALFDVPLMELVQRAAAVHRRFHDPTEVQVCQLVSIKTGGCPEDCAYCSQSVHNDSGVKPEALMSTGEVVAIARRAKANGVTRLCLGAAWREVKDNAQFDRVLDIVRDVAAEGLEVCTTLGMLTAEQAQRLEDAGLYAYNHNVDTSAGHYETIITTRTFQDRLDTIANVRRTGVTVCSGGILGMGESVDDRASMLHTLATLDPHPESVPVNVLSKVPGTPLADEPDVPIWETVRVITVARLLMPASVVRLSAGRHLMGFSDQALCFLAGANSIFSSERQIMLTSAVPCADHDTDQEMLRTMGLRPRPLDTPVEVG